MKPNIFSRARRRTGLLTTVVLLALALAVWVTSASDDDEKEKNKTSWTGAIFFGAGGVDKEGATGISGLSSGRAAEYSSAKNSPFLGLIANYDGGSTYWRVGGLFLNTEEAEAALYGSSGRVFLSDTKLARFIHRLDNDPATDWAASGIFALDSDTTGLNTRMEITDLRSANRFKIPSVPGATLHAHIRALWRAGDRQARTLDHCSTCHVSAAGQELNQRTGEFSVGGELARENFALYYEHTYRSFADAGTALTYNYANRFGNFDLEGIQPFAVTPDNSSNSDLGAARVDFGFHGSAVVKVRRSSTTNKSTNYSADATRFSGLLTLKPVHWLNIRGRYDRREENNETPLASERALDRFDGALSVRPSRALKLEGSYRWERIDRSGGTELDRTTTKSYRFKGILRPDKTLRLTASWRHAEVEDPFGRVLRNSFSRIDSVFLSPLGTEEDDLHLMLSYSPAAGSSVTATYSWRKSENPAVNLESKVQFISFNGSYSASKDIVFTGSFSHYANDVDRDIYLGVLAPLLEIVSVPYDGRGTTAHVGAWLNAGRGFSFRPGYAYTRAESGFGDSNLGTGVANSSAVDATIHRLELESRIGLYEKLDLGLAYYLDDYSDSGLPNSSGTVHWFYGGLQYKF